MNFTTSGPPQNQQATRGSTIKTLIIVGAILYCVSPIDFVPDIFPVVGWLDDVGVLAALVAYLSSQPKATGTTAPRVRDVSVVQLPPAKKDDL